MATAAPRVEIAVYDLLPDSRLATSLWYLGCGLYHTAVRIPDLQVEYAFGGLLPTLSSSRVNDERRNMTGIFSVPSGEDPRIVERLMPGLRFVRRIDVGPVRVAQGKGSKGYGAICILVCGVRLIQLSAEKPLPPIPHAGRRYPKLKREASHTSSLSNTPLLGSFSFQASSEDDSILDQSLNADEWGRRKDDHVSSPDSYSPSPFDERADNPSRMAGQAQYALHSVLAVLEDMKQDPDWRAVRYSLLTKNCNHFTNELCLRLSGKNAPAWISKLSAVLSCVKFADACC